MTSRRLASHLQRLALLGAGLALMHCAPASPEGIQGDDGGALEDGRSRGLIDLRPDSDTFSVRAQCNEWFSCDLEATITLAPVGEQAIYTEARARAERDEVDGNFRYLIPLFDARMVEVASGVYFEVDVVAEVSGAREDGVARTSGYTLFAAGDRKGREIVLFAESEDEDAAYDVELDSLMDFEGPVQVRISAEWY